MSDSDEEGGPEPIDARPRTRGIDGSGSDREWFSSDTDEDEFLLSAGRAVAAAAAARRAGWG